MLLVCVVLGLLLAAAGAKIVRLQEQVDAKPAVQDRIVYRKVQGPTRIEVRTITKPGGEVIVEKIRIVEKVVVDRQTEYAEVPAGALAPKKHPRWAYLDFNPASRTPYVPVGARMGHDIGRGSIGAWYYAPATAFGATAGFRF
jgi:hypothetical protein